MRTLGRRILVGLTAMTVAAFVWIPCLHLCFTKPASAFRQASGLFAKARQLAERHLSLCADPKLREPAMRRMRPRPL